MIRETYFIFKGHELSLMKCFSSSSKRFINSHKEDLEISKFDSQPLKVFYGESHGEFVYNRSTNEYRHDYGNLYKAKIITKIINELMRSSEVKFNG